MLVPYQTSGDKPPLFFVHGLRGIMFAVGTRFTRRLGADQPVYIVNANGMNGQEPAAEYVHEMVSAYLDEIRRAQPTGPLRIGGMCAGCMVAIEIARILQGEDRPTGPVILVDPPVLSVGYEKRQNAIELTPEFAERLYQEMSARFLERLSDPEGYDDLPFDPHDPVQLHSAALVAMRTTVAFAKHIPRPFSGAVDVIVSEDRASGFLHPQMPWRKLLLGSRMVHVVPLHHRELTRIGWKTVARLIKSMLEEEPAPEAVPERQMPPALFDA